MGRRYEVRLREDGAVGVCWADRSGTGIVGAENQVVESHDDRGRWLLAGSLSEGRTPVIELRYRSFAKRAQPAIGDAQWLFVSPWWCTVRPRLINDTGPS